MTIDQPAVHGDDARKAPSLSRLHDNDETISASDEDIRGRMVKDKDGREIGKIEHLLIDDIEHKVRLMEIGAGGFLGLGETKSFIPVEAITRITADEVFISPTAEHVGGAPPYDPDLVAIPSEDYTAVYSYYGYEGYQGTAPWITSWPYTREPGG